MPVSLLQHQLAGKDAAQDQKIVRQTHMHTMGSPVDRFSIASVRAGDEV